MTDFVSAFSLINKPSDPNFQASQDYLRELLEQNPSAFLEGIVSVISDPEIPLSLRLYAIKQSTALAHIKRNNKAYATSVEMKEVESELIDRLIEVLSQFMAASESVLPETTELNTRIDFIASAAKSMAHYRIAQYLIQGGEEAHPYPALEFTELITDESSTFTCDAACIAIEAIIDALPLSKSSVAEHVIGTLLTRMSNAENSLVFKHLFINISGKILKVAGSLIIEKNIALGVSFLGKIDELMNELPEEIFWFWSQVPNKCYRLLRLAADLPQIMFDKVEEVTAQSAEEGATQEIKEKGDKILIYIMQFWYSVARIESTLPESFDMVEGYLPQIINLGLFIIQADQSTETYTHGDYTSLIAAMDTLRIVVANKYEASFAVLSEFISENANSESKSTKFAVAFAYNSLIQKAQPGSDEFQQLASISADIIGEMIQDDAPRVVNAGISAICYTVVSGASEMTQGILETIVEQTSSEEKNIQSNAIQCLGTIGATTKDTSLASTIIQVLLQFVSESEDATVAAHAMSQVEEMAISIEEAEQIEVFDLVADFIGNIIENPDHPCLQPAVAVLNKIFTNLVVHYKQDIDEDHLQKYIELGNALLETSASPAGINCLSIACFSFGSELQDLLQQFIEIIDANLTTRDNIENTKAAIKGCLHIIHACKEPEVLQMLAEKNMEVLQDETIDPNIQAFSLNVFNSIASINQEIVAQFIEPLSLATLRMLSNSGMFDDLLYVYEIIPVISHFIEAGSEGDALLLKMLSKAIKSIGMLSVIPDNVCDVSIDLLYLASTRFQEFWETARTSKAARNIIKAAEVCTDPTTVQRKTALKPQIPE